MNIFRIAVSPIAVLFAFGILFSIAADSPVRAASKPPTVDPTYGIPVPWLSANPAPEAQSSWIWASSTSDNQTVLFRRDITLAAPPQAATIYITADDTCALFVNGRSVPLPDGNTQFSWQSVRKVDIAPELIPGGNVIAVSAVNHAGPAGLIAWLTIPGVPPISTDSTWKVNTGVISDSAWTTPTFDDSGWAAATVEAEIGGGVWGDNLTGWPGSNGSTAGYLQHIRLPVTAVAAVHPGAGAIANAGALAGKLGPIVTITPVTTEADDKPYFVVDFGKEVAGRVRIVAQTAGTIQVGTGESFDEATQSPWGGLHGLDLKPDETSYTPYSAFRYAIVKAPVAANGDPIRFAVDLDDKYYPVNYAGSFDCSDPLLTKIWYTGAYTAHLCMQEQIWDAPKRDRALWSGDLHVSGGVIDDVFADRFLMERTLSALRKNAQGGRPASAVPVDDVNGIPGYSCAWVCMLADFYRHTGDRAFLMSQHDLLVSLLALLRTETDDRNLFVNKLNRWAYTDWSPGLDGNPASVDSNTGALPPTLAATDLFIIKAAREAAFLFSSMGDSSHAAANEKWADDLTVAARRYLDASDPRSYGNRIQVNAMAVYGGAATRAQRESIYARVLDPDSAAWDEDNEPANNEAVITPYYGSYVLRALSLTGHTESGLKLLRRYWGGMLAEGATTFWEGYDTHWRKDHFHRYLIADDTQGTNASLCHGWSSGPTSWLTDCVLGVRPTSGGFRTAIIAPDLGDLTWASGAVPTPRGPIRVYVSKSSRDDFEADIAIPAGTDATVTLPGSKLLLEGRPVAKAASADGHVSIEIARPGRYVLAAK